MDYIGEYNLSYPFMEEPTTMDYFNGMAIFQLTVFLLGTLAYIFIMSAIASDRKRYETTYWLTLLNFSVAFALSCIVRYFREVHLNVVPESNEYICHTVHFLGAVIGDGAEIAILPVGIDLIVQNLKPERYEKRKYKVFLLILVLVSWLFLAIKEIIHRQHSIIEFHCYESYPLWIMWSEFVFTIIRICIFLTLIGFLSHVAKTNGETACESFGFLGAPLIISIILSIASILDAIYQGILLILNNDVINIGVTNHWYRLFLPLGIAIAWLADKNYRASVKRLLTCGACREATGRATEHELNTRMV